MGAGAVYAKKHFCVFRGSRRVTASLGYTHIEGVIID